MEKKAKEAKVKNIIKEKCDCSKFHHSKCNAGVYGLGLIGSAIFFISQAETFWQGVLGFLKAIIWPAFMTYELFKFLIN